MQYHIPNQSHIQMNVLNCGRSLRMVKIIKFSGWLIGSVEEYDICFGKLRIIIPGATSIGKPFTWTVDGA